jgi:hypothetical protein
LNREKALRSSASENWRDRLAQRVPERLRDTFQTSAKSSLLKQVNTVLMVHGDRLYDLRNGSWRSLQLEGVRPLAASVAQAAADLLEASASPRGIMLLLAAHEFLATHTSMPGVARESLRSALQLQALSMLPGYEEDLALAVNVHERSASSENASLWIPVSRLDNLFDAFSEHGLFLAAVMPRMVAPAASFGDVLLNDRDAITVTCIHYRNGVIVRWLQTSQSDMQDPALAQQWQDLIRVEESRDNGTPDLAQLDLRGPDDYLAALTGRIAADLEYTFIPAGAESKKSQLLKGRRLGMLAVAVGIVALIAVLPFLVQTIQLRSLEANLQRYQQQAAGARGNQRAVRAVEQEWGAFLEFPRQNLSSVLITLQDVIAPGVLTALDVNEGFVSLEGDSPDPQSLLERLEQNEMFTEVDFARATSNMRYFIDLRLATVDFPAYRQWYFPNVR